MLMCESRCESNKLETIRTNVIGTLSLADCCQTRGIHMTNYATGCIFEYDAAHPQGSGKGFKEEDKANFTGQFTLVPFCNPFILYQFYKPW